MVVALHYLLAAFCVLVQSQSRSPVNYEVLDLHPFVVGLGHPTPSGAQRYWIDQQTIKIPIGAVDSFLTASRIDSPNYLWEASVHSDVLGRGTSSCEYSIGWVRNSTHFLEERSGVMGKLGSELQRSTSILWLQGETNAYTNYTHVYLSIDSCYLSRYITRMEFGKWNGQAYLLDLTNKTAFINYPAWINELEKFHVLWDDLHDLANPVMNAVDVLDTRQYEINRDTTMFDMTGGYFGGYALRQDYTVFPVIDDINDREPYSNATLYGYNRAEVQQQKRQKMLVLDYSMFTTPGANFCTKPVLDLWGYLSPQHGPNPSFNYGSLVFAQCSTGASVCGDRQSYSTVSGIFGSRSNIGDQGFFRTYFDLRRFYRSQLNTNGLTESSTLLVVNQNNFAVFPPYAKIWDFEGTSCTTTGCNQILWNLGGASVFEQPGEGCTRYLGDGANIDASLNLVSPNNVTANAYGLYFARTAPVTANFINGTGLQSYLAFFCNVSNSPALITLSTPTQISGLINPFFSFGEITTLSGPSLGASVGYSISSAADGVIFDSDYPASPASGVYEFQVSLGHYSVLPSVRYTIKQNGHFAMQAVAPLISGAKDYCMGVFCGNTTYNSTRPNGMCVSQLFGYQCICEPGWSGVNCTTRLPAATFDCLRNDSQCLNGGACQTDFSFNPPRYQCVCATGFGGPNCLHWLNTSSCLQSQCLNGGTCVPDTGIHKFKCNCLAAWQGRWCERRVDNCAVDPFACNKLQDAANQCVSNPAGGYSCSCSANWTGSACETPAVCAAAVNPCLNGGQCVAVNVSSAWVARCVCPTNFYGARCEYTYNQFLQDCNVGNSPCVSNNTVNCTNVGDGIVKCRCKPLWHGLRCELHDTCDPVNPCKNGGRCSFVDGKATCTCTGNWFGDFCDEDITTYFDDCRFGGCSGHGTCTGLLASNGRSTWQCRCAADYHGPACETPDVCAVGVNPCQNGGLCTRHPSQNSAVCMCTGGFIGSRCESALPTLLTSTFSATIVNECTSPLNRCLNGASCVLNANTNRYFCNCSAHYHGARCEIPRACTPNPCMNGGLCSLSSNQTATCTCTGEFTGKNCEITYNQFFNYDCRFRGCGSDPLSKCLQVSTNQYACQCSPAWSGKYCDESSACAVNPCHNGGTCRFDSVRGQAICLCPGEYYGEACEYTVASGLADCRTMGCQNGGKCGLFNENFVCQCLAGTHGPFCEVVAACNPNPCLNGGLCVDAGSNTAKCLCTGDWTGALCATKVSDELALKIAALNKIISPEIISEVAAYIFNSTTVNLNNVKNLYANTAASITQLQKDVTTLRASAVSVGSQNTNNMAQINKIRSTFATKAEVETLKATLDELLSKNN